MPRPGPPERCDTRRLQSRPARRRARAPLMLLASAFLLAFSPWSPARDALGGDEIRALISGNTLQGSYMTNPLTMVFYPDGTLRGAIGLTGSDSGTWAIEGDKYCHLWFTYFSAIRRCYEWIPRDDGYLLENVDAFKARGIQGRIQKGKPKGY